MTGLRYADGGPSFRISPKRSRPPSPYGECSEAAEFYSIDSDQCRGNLVENCIDGLFGVLGVQTRILLRDPRNQFRFDHEPPSHRPKRSQGRAIVVKAPTVIT